MNDISVKIVESPNVAESPAAAGGIEVDPLAVDDGVEAAKSPADIAPGCGDEAENESSAAPNEDLQSLEAQPEVKDIPAVTEDPLETTEPIKSILENFEDKTPTPTDVEAKTATETIESTCEIKTAAAEEDPLTLELNSPNSKPETTEGAVESTPDIVESTTDIAESTPEVVESKTNTVESTPEIVESTTDIVESTPDKVKSTPEKVESTPEADNSEEKPKSVEPQPEIVETIEEIAKPTPQKLESPELALNTSKPVPDTEATVSELRKSRKPIDSKQETLLTEANLEIAPPALEKQVPSPATKPPSPETTGKISSPEVVAILSPEVVLNLQSQTNEAPTDVEMAELPPPKKALATPVLASALNENKVLEKEVKEKKRDVITVRNFEKERATAVNQSTGVNGDIAKEDQATKRRASEEAETESPLKKLCQEVERTFGHHDAMVNEYIQSTTKNNIDEIQRHTEQLLAEIQTLRELAQKKEYEWNNILHLKKVKEEILLRLLRRKQVLLFEKTTDVNGAERTNDPFDYLNQAKNLAIDKSDEISGLAIKQPGSASPMMQTPMMPVVSIPSHYNPMAGLPPPYDKAAQPHMSMPKPVFQQPMMMPGMPGFPRDMNGQLSANFNMPMGRQGPTKDVKSIIADYRQRNPDVTPRRGRRMKSILNPNMMNAPRSMAPKVDGLNNLNNLSNLGSLNNLNNLGNLTNLNMLFNNLDMNQKAMLERLQQLQAGGLQNSIFKDALVQFANMQQGGGPGLGPPPAPRPESIGRPEHTPKERRRERPSERAHESPPPPKAAPRVPPPPYPEISLLPVAPPATASASAAAAGPADAHTQNSLLHGILTKQASCGAGAGAGSGSGAGSGAGAGAGSPTLARLLTSPERRAALSPYGQAKNCGEITITPVQPTQPEPQQEKPEEVVQLDDEESPPSEGEVANSPAGSSAGRLVIDEGGADSDTPLCQGCRRRDAQFVCAGCANQWYCSRECQVAAWDEHSEMCSG